MDRGGNCGAVYFLDRHNESGLPLCDRAAGKNALMVNSYGISDWACCAGGVTENVYKFSVVEVRLAMGQKSFFVN